MGRRHPFRAAALLGAALGLAAASAGAAERGRDGELRLLYWQAISGMNPFITNGTKDIEAASLVLEPLARYDEAAELVPWLAEAIPTVENGGVSPDLRTITWTLAPGLLWSDGTRVTAADAVFTWGYCAAPATGCAQASHFADVAAVEALDDRRIQVRFSRPKPFPYGPFVGAQSPILQAAQFAACSGPAASDCAANARPIGTGPFVVTDFRPNDRVLLAANPHYRDPEKPAFASVRLEGGGDASAAARAVLVDGRIDYAWNTLVAPEVLAQFVRGGKGEPVFAFGTLVERIAVNQTDPDPGLGAERSTAAHPHPILTDSSVVRALSLALDREILVEAGYGAAGRVACGMIPAPDYNTAPKHDGCRQQDVDLANRLLEAAGWRRGPDGVRARDGRRLSLRLASTTNSVRQGAQALIRQWWAAIGVEAVLKTVDGAVFFGADPGEAETIERFPWDLAMFADTFDGTDPEEYLGTWACAAIPSPSTGWIGPNTARWCDPGYEAALGELRRTSGRGARGARIIDLDARLVASPAVIPLVHRARLSVRANSLGGVRMHAWDSELWNVADWYRAE